jgi:hypothetical protein
MFSCGLNVLLNCSGHSTVEIVCFFNELSAIVLPRVIFKKCLDCLRYIYESQLSETVFIWQVVCTEGRRQNDTTAASESGCVINTTECSSSREKERER